MALVGHDIGLMVAYAYAAQHPGEVERVVLMDAFLAGIGAWRDVWLMRDLGHFHFYGETPLALVSGRRVRAARRDARRVRVVPRARAGRHRLRGPRKAEARDAGAGARRREGVGRVPRRAGAHGRDRRAERGDRGSRSGVAGIQTTVLQGDPTRARLYTILLRVPPNTRIEAHVHPDDRVATVLSGTWYFGYGERFDERELRALPAGSFYTEPPGDPHFARTGAALRRDTRWVTRTSSSCWESRAWPRPSRGSRGSSRRSATARRAGGGRKSSSVS